MKRPKNNNLKVDTDTVLKKEKGFRIMDWPELDTPLLCNHIYGLLSQLQGQ